MSDDTMKKAEQLADEAVEQVTGGFDIEMTTFIKCPICQHGFPYNDNDSGEGVPITCPKCGYKWVINSNVNAPV